jgi:hypothetical protein
MITIDAIMELDPCPEYSRERVEELWAGRESITMIELLDLDIPVCDWIWAADGLLDPTSRRLLACDIAEELAMPVWRERYPDDDRPQRAIDVSRRYARGEATIDELSEAMSAAIDAAWAASHAAWSAAKAAVDAAKAAVRAGTDRDNETIIEIARRYA